MKNYLRRDHTASSSKSCGFSLLKTAVVIVISAVMLIMAADAVAGTCAPVNGACGPANGVAVSSIPAYNLLCNPGIPTAVAGNGPWTWGCDGNYAGTNTAANACSAPDSAVPVNGICGASADTCSAGTASNYDAPNGTWTCDGENGGSNAPCSVPINGLCGASADTCSAGTASNYDAPNGTWTCDGENGGSNAPCSVPIHGQCGVIIGGLRCSGADTCLVGAYNATWYSPPTQPSAPADCPGGGVIPCTFTNWSCGGLSGGSPVDCSMECTFPTH